MANVLDYIPNAEGIELNHLQGLFAQMDEAQARRFASVYATRRRDPTTMLIVALLGFFGVAGIHRFLLNQIGMGILYLLTVGLCWIGTIIDLVNIRNMTAEYNIQVATEVANAMR